MNKNTKKFIKSLKFKMALLYSGILLVFCAGFLILMNVFLVDYMQRDVSAPRMIVLNSPDFMNLNDEKKNLLQESRENDLQNIRLISIYSILPFVLLSFVGGYLIADNSLKPLENLNEEIKKKSTKNLSQKIDFKDNGDEISELIQNFNNMSEQLSRAFEAQKEFVENASHELKTPLAIIQANVDSVLEDSKIPRKDLIEMLGDSKKSLLFMNKLTEDLLLLSLVDVDFGKEKLNLNKVLDNAVIDARKLADGHGFAINVKSDDNIEMSGNEVLLRRAFQNLIENSIKYSQGDKLDIRMKKVENEIVLTFKDNGVGIPKGAQGKIFDRFYRVDKSRSRKTGGSGLGLAITKEIIEKHKGIIKYINGKGAEFDVKFPA